MYDDLVNLFRSKGKKSEKIKEYANNNSEITSSESKIHLQTLVGTQTYFL